MYSQGGTQDLAGGGGQELFSVKFGDLHVAKRHAVCYGFSEHAPPLENIF